MTKTPTTKSPAGVKRLYIDCETSPNICMSWRIGYKINLDYSNILKERAIICVCWKWAGDSTVHSLTWDKNQCDRAMLARLVDVINEADEVVGHNGDSFDVPWIRTRLLYHGLPPLSPDLKTVDTLQWARRKFYFNSNKLDYIGKYLGLGEKIKTEYGLWKRVVLEKDAAALREMVTYCKGDIVLLEKVWGKLAPTVKPKTHAGVVAGGEKWSCPRTGSTNVYLSKTRVTAGGAVQYQMISKTDGTYYSINESAYQAYKEAKKLNS